MYGCHQRTALAVRNKPSLWRGLVSHSVVFRGGLQRLAVSNSLQQSPDLHFRKSFATFGFLTVLPKGKSCLIVVCFQRNEGKQTAIYGQGSTIARVMYFYVLHNST